MHITVENAAVTIGSRTVLANASASAAPGRVLALVGPSGSGKTTLLGVMGMLRTIDSGRVLVDGVDASGWKDAARVRFWRRHAAFVFQDYGLIEERSVAHNVALSGLRTWGTPRSARHRVAAVLERVGLADRIDETVARLSGGEKQRVGIARAMFREADVILADEPTASLDAENRDSVIALLRGEAARGATVIVATHDAPMIAASDVAVPIGGAGRG